MSISGSCHCGATKFTVESSPSEVTQCTCSLCSKRGALWAYYQPNDVTIAPQSTTATYRWQSMTVEHNFCPACGCVVNNLSPNWSTGKPDFTNMNVSLNARLFDDFDITSLPVTVLDGKNLW